MPSAIVFPKTLKRRRDTQARDRLDKGLDIARQMWQDVHTVEARYDWTETDYKNGPIYIRGD